MFSSWLLFLSTGVTVFFLLSVADCWAVMHFFVAILCGNVGPYVTSNRGGCCGPGGAAALVYQFRVCECRL